MHDSPVGPLAIQPYQFEIKHRQDQENGNADGLSRCALATDYCEMMAISSDDIHDRHREGEGCSKVVCDLTDW